MKRYWRCSRGCRWLLTFLLLNQENGVNNERSQSTQSVRHSKRTHRMWPHLKKKTEVRRGGGGGGGGGGGFSRIARSWQSSVQVHAWISDTVTDQRCRLHSDIMDIYVPVFRSSPCLKWCPTQGDFTPPDYLPCYFRKSSIICSSCFWRKPSQPWPQRRYEFVILADASASRQRVIFVFHFEGECTSQHVRK